MSDRVDADLTTKKLEGSQENVGVIDNEIASGNVSCLNGVTSMVLSDPQTDAGVASEF